MIISLFELDIGMTWEMKGVVVYWTLHARIMIPEPGVTVTQLWCILLQSRSNLLLLLA